MLRYASTSGTAWLATRAFEKSWETRRIGSGRSDPNRLNEKIASDMAWSLQSSAVFAIVGAALWHSWKAGITRIYTTTEMKDWLWMPLSFVLLAFLQDAWFYLIHSWMHRPAVYKKIHFAHHQSRRPTAWTAFAFHPAEALIQSLLLPIALLFIPVHVFAIGLLFSMMTVTGVMNHMGYELYPRPLMESRWIKYWVTASHHQIHHDRPNKNFGLFFTFMDRAFGTEYEGIQPK